MTISCWSTTQNDGQNEMDRNYNLNVGEVNPKEAYHEYVVYVAWS